MSFWISQDKNVEHDVKIYKLIFKNKNEFIFECSYGKIKISFFTNSIVRIVYNLKGEFLKCPSFSVVIKPCEDVDVKLIQSDECTILKTEQLEIIINKETSKIEFIDDKKYISNISNISWIKDDNEGFIVKSVVNPNENSYCYGLGEKNGFLDKKGREYMMWNTDETLQNPVKDPLYKSIPFLISHSKTSSYGLFIDKTCALSIDLRDENNHSIKVNDYESDFYFINGNNLKEIVAEYTNLTGKINLPPLWSLGYQQSRWSYFPDDKVLEIAKGFRKNKIPCDVIYLDIDYMDGYRVFTWSNNRFKNPRKLIKELKELGFKVVTIIDPGVKIDPEYEVYIKGLKKDLFCKFANGKIFEGNVWPGDCVFPDFTKNQTKEWWGDLHEELFDLGIEGIWNDMNEPSNFVSNNDSDDRKTFTIHNDVILDNNGYKRPFSKYHNIYANSMCESTMKGFEKYLPEKRPFILTRAAYAGIQKNAAVWTGDNSSWWEHLENSIAMCLNIGLSGVPFVGADIGGFHDNATSELFIRWIQLGVFIPFFRGHSAISSKDHEPWTFDYNTTNITKKYIELRYKLLPYIYSEFYKTSKTGLPIMKPLVLEYSSDENVYNLSDEFLFGENMLVAPICRPGKNKKMVYLPKGIWFDYWTNEEYIGEQYIVADAPIDRIPLFIKGGSIIPMTQVVNYINEKTIKEMELYIYKGDGSYTIYEDDGSSFKYKNNEYNLIDFKLNNKNNSELVFNILYKHQKYKNEREKFKLNFININKQPKNVILNGNKITNYKLVDKNLLIEIYDKYKELHIKIEY